MNFDILPQQTLRYIIMRVVLLFIFLFCFSVGIFAQFNPGAKQISLSHSDIAYPNDVFALFSNPSGLSQLNWREIGIYYSPAPFGLSELANGYFAYIEPFDFGSIAIGGMTYGFELYRESKISLGYSYNYDNKFFAGAVINYHSFSIQKYGSDGVFYFNLGGLAYITNVIRWGFAIDNINRATLANEDDQIPMVFSTGFSYDIINTFTLDLALEKDIRFKPSFKVGIDYDIIQYISLRIGIANEPSTFSAGVGINYSIFSLDYALIKHPDLGLTHQAGIILSFGRDEPRRESIRKYLEIAK